MNSSTNMLLTIEDFEQLQKNNVPESREKIARKIGSHFDCVTKDSVEHHIASEIAMYLQKDSEKLVRIALSESVYSSETAPKKLIMLLAMDDEDVVSLPVLEHSPIIKDEDLKHILPEIDVTSRLVAVAKRKFISVTVTTMLADRNIEDVAVALLSNESAIIDDEVILHIAYQHANSKSVFGRMMKRMPLPTSAVNHMVKMQQSGGQDNHIPAEIKSFSSLDSKELKDDILTLMFLGRDPSVDACKKMIQKFESQGKLSATLMLLAMCVGQNKFFVTYMSDNTNLPYDRVKELCSVGEKEFSMLMNKSGISPSLYSLMYHVYTGMGLNLLKGKEEGTKEFAEVMVECLIGLESQGVNFATTIGKPISKALKDTFA